MSYTLLREQKQKQKKNRTLNKQGVDWNLKVSQEAIY